ncbi:MAG: hypothetical protein NT080_01035 [Spirochaetes bacterium]|nr:hypothetical protein [Spirochaetota bacterium]
MPLETGHFITLGIVIIVLAVYRFLDRSNRSLEKVKKFTDRLRDELSAYVDKRSEDLNSYGIELDVRQKAARVALDKVREAEEALNSRAEAIGTIGSRIAEYDNALAQLMKMTQAVDANLRRMHDESVFVDGVSGKLEKARESMDLIEAELPVLREGFIADARDELRQVRDGVSEEADRRLGEVSAEIDGLASRADEKAQSVQAAYREAAERARFRAAEIEAMLADAFKRARAEAESLEDATYEKLKAQIDGRGDKLREALESKFQTVQQAAKDRLVEAQALARSVKSEWQKEAEELIEGNRAEMTAEAERLAARIGAAESRVADAEKLYEERYGRVERKFVELADALGLKVKDNLKALQEDLVRRQAELKSSTRESVAESKRELEEATRNFTDGASALQSELSGAEARAKEATRAMGERMAKELADAEKRVASEAGAAIEKARIGVEETAGKLVDRAVALEIEAAETDRRGKEIVLALNEKIAREGAETEKRLAEGFDGRLEAYRSDVERRIAKLEDAETDIGRLDRALRETMTGVQRAVGEDFERFGRDFAERKISFEAEMKAEYDRMRSSMESIEKDLNVLKTQAYSNVSEKLRLFEDDFFSGLKTRSEDVEVKLSGWKTELDASLGKLSESARKDWASAEKNARDQSERDTKAHRESVHKAIREAETEHASLSQKISSYAAEIARFRTELSEQTSETLRDFTRTRDGLSADAARRAKEIEDEIALAQEDFRRSAQEARERLESGEKQVLARFDQESRERQAHVADIDRRVKDFTSQTKLFERADELRAGLAERIEGLKAEAARVESRRGELAEIDNRMTAVRKLEEDLNQKLGRFTAEKRRVDALEEDFNRLLALSAEVDRKLAQVNSSGDALTQIQAEVRKLSELSSEAESKYQRLEKKSNILDTTIDAVDKNFAAVQGLEKTVRELDAAVKGYPERVAELGRSIDFVLDGKEKIDVAAEKLEGIETAMADLEKRSEEVGKAREWLARTETRLEEINRKATDQLKLLNSLLKEEAGSGKKERGAPSVSVQETVRKLAHQGWTVEEIARTVKLSRGEVELILELGSKT